MAVRPLRDGRYVVETEGGTYVVDLEAGTCSCPDSEIRGARCKHRRRVAIEVTGGLVPAPDRRGSACAVCGRRLFVPMVDPGPSLCGRHDHDPGALVTDRETGGRLVVVRATGRRADAFRTGEGRLVADYETNAAYGAHEPVFECVYLDSLRRVDDLASVTAADRYAFPASRLVRVDAYDGERRDVTADGAPSVARSSG